MSKSMTGIKHRPMSEDGRRNIGLSQKGKKLSEETKRKISIANTGKKHTDETRKKLRIARYNQALKAGITGGPMRGYNEEDWLNDLEERFNIHIIRQYPVAGYFVDGYCKKLNTVFEIDEKHHKRPKQIIKDNYRQSIIEKELKCEFIRIDDE